MYIKSKRDGESRKPVRACSNINQYEGSVLDDTVGEEVKARPLTEACILEYEDR